MDIRTKIPNKRARIAITDITNQDFSKLIKEFKNSTYIGYKKKYVHNGDKVIGTN